MARGLYFLGNISGRLRGYTRLVTWKNNRNTFTDTGRDTRDNNQIWLDQILMDCSLTAHEVCRQRPKFFQWSSIVFAYSIVAGPRSRVNEWFGFISYSNPRLALILRLCSVLLLK